MRAYYTGRDMRRILTVDEMRAAALRRLPPMIAEYLEGGAEDELTLARNRAAFQAQAFRPHMLRSTAHPSLNYGDLALPLAIAPTGFAGLLAPNGDQALARAAKTHGIAMCQSTVSNATLEQLAPILGPHHWMQIYVFRDRGFMQALLNRCRIIGITRLIVTLDASIFGNREWDRRNYLSNGHPRFGAKIKALRHPRWMRQVWWPGLPSFGNLADYLPKGQGDLASAAAWSRREIETELDLKWLDWLRENWPGELWVKGVLRSDDARQLIAAGVNGLVVSNHGGRQLDGAIASYDALPEIVAAAAGAVPIWLDSGIRRGSDIAKALIQGADGVMAGRALLYGLAAGGEAGAARVIEILTDELQRVMALLGAKDLAALRDPSLLAPLRGALLSNTDA